MSLPTAPRTVFRWLISVGFALAVSAGSPVFAIDNSTLTQAFDDYQESIEKLNDLLAEAIASNKWDTVSAHAGVLKSQSEHFIELSKNDGETLWGTFADNLDHHTIELQDAIRARDAPEAISLSGTLIAHLGYIQSTNALWLREYYPRQLEQLKTAVQERDVTAVSSHAEALHLGANKIGASAGMQKDLYTHTRWLKDVIGLSELGDSVIGAAQQGDWGAMPDKIKRIDRIINKWSKAFKQ
jgi:hypothetical protein